MSDTSAADTGRKTRTVLAAALAVVAVGVLLRALFLDADPRYPHWAGYVTDEGRWTEQARNLALFGSMDLDWWISRTHLVLAPAFQAAVYVSFLLFGVGFSAARLVSVVGGVVLLLIAFFHLRDRVGKGAFMLALVLLAVHPDLVFLSRAAIPEMHAMMFELAAFALLVSAPRSEKRALAAGILTAAGLGMKATIAPIVPIFLLVLLVVHEAHDPATRKIRAVAYLGGLMVPALAAGAALATATGLPAVDALTTALLELRHYLRVDTPFGVASFLLYRPWAHVLNVLLLACWTLAGILLAAGRLPDGGSRGLYLGSALWVGGWLATASILDYFPQRYVFHALVPLILNVAAGLAQVRGLGAASMLDLAGNPRARRHRWIAPWISLPFAVLLAPPMSALAETVGIELDRLSEQLTLILLLDLILAWLVLRFRPQARVLAFLLVAPLIITPLWFVSVELDLIGAGYWTLGDTGSRSAWLLLLAVGGGVAALAWKGRFSTWTIRTAVYVYFGIMVGVWAVRSAPLYLNPTYTIARASEDLGELIDPSAVVATRAAGSLFLGNEVKWVEGRIMNPEVVVTAMERSKPEGPSGYRLVRQYTLDLGGYGLYARGDMFDRMVRVYRRAPQEQPPAAR